jgi:hypothetical protein
MADKVNPLAEQKRHLIARSEMCRQSLAADFRNIKEAAAWVPRTIRAVRTVYPALLLAAPLAGLIFRKKRFIPEHPPPPKKGLLSKAAAGIKLFRTVKPFWDGFRHGRKVY